MSEFLEGSCARVAVEALYSDAIPDWDPLTDEPEPDSYGDPNNVIRIRRRLGSGSLRGQGLCREVALNKDRRELIEVNLDPAEREAVVEDLVCAYVDHPYVRSKLAAKSLPVINTDSLRSMMSAITEAVTRVPVLHPDEERLHFENIDKGVQLYGQGVDLENLAFEDEETILDMVVSRQILLLANLRYVYSLVKKYPDIPGLPREDVFHEGLTGLSTAIGRFEVNKGYRLLTYADFWIKRNIQFAYSDKSRVIRVARDKHNKGLAINGVINRLSQDYRREPTKSEVAEHVGMSVEELDAFLQASQEALSFSTGIGDVDSDVTLGDVIADPETSTRIDSGIDINAQNDYLNRLYDLADLTDKAKVVLSICYPGLMGLTSNLVYKRQGGQEVDCSVLVDRLKSGEEIEQREIARILGVTPRSIREVRDNALRALREAADKIEFV